MPAILWAGVIFYLSSGPVDVAPGLAFEGIDKVAHAVAYGLLAFLLRLAFRRGNGWQALPASVAAVVLAAIYGITDEVHQLFVPTRQSDLLDWIADAAGASCILLGLLRKPAAMTGAGGAPASANATSTAAEP
jgi:hypothetical protein